MAGYKGHARRGGGGTAGGGGRRSPSPTNPDNRRIAISILGLLIPVVPLGDDAVEGAVLEAVDDIPHVDEVLPTITTTSNPNLLRSIITHDIRMDTISPRLRPPPPPPPPPLLLLFLLSFHYHHHLQQPPLGTDYSPPMTTSPPPPSP